MDCSIIKIENGRNKRTVKLTTLPSDYKIPTMVMWSEEYLNEKNGVLTLGISALNPISFNLNRVPHVLVAGETGSGKSVILRCLLWQLIEQGARVYMIDFKGGVEFGKQYEQYGEVITERERALQVLELLVKENEYRLRIFRDLEVKNLDEYNKKTKQNLCRIGVFTDELAEMLDKKGVAKEEREIYEKIEGRLSTLARLSRATGINLFMGVQRPDANVLTGQIKNNIPVRISGRFADKTASEIVLGNTDAVNLPDIKGRFLYKVGNETIEFQSFYFDDETMLREVCVDQGEMLTEAPVYKVPEHKAPVQKTENKKAEVVRSGRKEKRLQQ
ncbi:MAG: helicase HerA-like domain-containing protein [Waltera sp.]